MSHLRSWLEVFGLVVRSGSFGIGWLPASVWLDLSTFGMKGFVQQEGEYSEPFKIPSEGGRGRALAVCIFGLFFLFGDAKTAL